MRLDALLKRDDPEPPVDPKTLRQDQRAILTAYGRACSVRWLGQTVTIKLVADYAQDDWGHGTVARVQVAKVVQELLDMGWPLVLENGTGGKRPGKAKATPAPAAPVQSTTPVAADRPKPAEAQVKKPRGKKLPLVPQLNPSEDDPEVLKLSGEVEPRTVVVRQRKQK